MRLGEQLGRVEDHMAEDRVLKRLIEDKTTAVQNQEELINEQRENYAQEIANRDEQITALRGQLSQITAEKDNLQDRLSQTTAEKDVLVQQLNRIYTSHFWKTASLYYRLRDRTPLRFVHRTFSILRREGLRGLRERAKGKVKRPRPSQIELEFDPYKKLQVLKPIGVVLIEKDYLMENIGEYPKFSVLIPVKNEEKTIRDLLESLKNQMVKPDEMVFIDDGSTDRTVETIESYQKEHPELPIKLFESSKKSLAKNRNLALNLAKNEMVVFLDAGNKFDSSLLANLIGAFKEHPDADLVAGIYKPLKETYWNHRFLWDWGNLDFKEFLPSAKVLLIKKGTALEIGGFPEFLPYTGEDTLFAINYRKVSQKWVFNKKVVIYWHAPENKEQALKKGYLYGKGDGENGYGEFRFYEGVVRHLRGEKVDFGDEVINESFKGHLEGRENRLSLWQSEKSIFKNFLILSGVPFSDSGGGQRGAQLALELMKRNCKVSFCNVYPSFEKELKVYLDMELPLLELWYFKHFNLEDYLQRHKEVLANTVLLLEFPHPEFIPIIDKLKKVCPEVKVMYDCIDNWDSDLGWTWYSRDKELEIIEKADLLITSAGTLKARLENMADKPVHLILNAVNTRVFSPQKFPITHDLPLDKPVVMYVGALWGKWFDWPLVYYAVQCLPEFNFVLIGNIPQDKEDYFKDLPNVKMLGLKPQFELPKYLTYASVCIIPFKYDENIIRYTNPLKVYEYLAMGKPIVATFMDEIESLPGVVIASNKDEFVSKIKEFVTRDLKCNQGWSDFIKTNHSWTHRVSSILEVLERQ
jgi:glycosyltransferase involved in cell wall biosynthesis